MKDGNPVETLQEGIWAIDMDANTTFVNRRMAKMLGYTIEEIDGRSLFNFMDDQGRRVAEQNMDNWKSGIREHHNFEFLKKDGDRMYASLETCSIIDTMGNDLGILIGVVDITERRKVKERLQESEVRLRFLVSLTPITIYSSKVCGDYGVTFVSETVRENLGYEPEDFTTDSGFWQRNIHPDDVARVLEELSRQFVQDNSVREYRIRHKDGTWRWMHDESRLIRTTDGNPVEIIGFWADITDCKETEDAIYKRFQNLHLLTGHTRYDIFNQLSAVHLLHNFPLSKGEPDETSRFISLVHESCQQIREIIGFIRECETFEAISSGWHQIHRVIESAKKGVALGGVTVDNQIPKDLDIYADPIIRRIFSMLLENVIRYGGVLSTIRFSCYELMDTLFITVEDNRSGFPQDKDGLILEHEYGKHTCIGLFMAREILWVTGFSIRECGVETKGSKFEIILPYGKFRREG